MQASCCRCMAAFWGEQISSRKLFFGDAPDDVIQLPLNLRQTLGVERRDAQSFCQLGRGLGQLLRTHDAEYGKDADDLREVDAVPEEDERDEYREELSRCHNPSKGERPEHSDGGVDAELTECIDDAQHNDPGKYFRIFEGYRDGGSHLCPSSQAGARGDEETEHVASYHHLSLSELFVFFVKHCLPLRGKAVADEENHQHDDAHAELVRHAHILIHSPFLWLLSRATVFAEVHDSDADQRQHRLEVLVCCVVRAVERPSHEHARQHLHGLGHHLDGEAHVLEHLVARPG
mmetsp:Transcript_53954/g.115201  ORF Transcript_53954/g.115201 Transcript_53954/m.115201 type:complete len:290 (+) Transcript_53954:496-1365(+)